MIILLFTQLNIGYNFILGSFSYLVPVKIKFHHGGVINFFQNKIDPSVHSLEKFTKSGKVQWSATNIYISNDFYFLNIVHNTSKWYTKQWNIDEKKKLQSSDWCTLNEPTDGLFTILISFFYSAAKLVEKYFKTALVSIPRNRKREKKWCICPFKWKILVV